MTEARVLRVSVIIPSYNRADRVPSLLTALLQQEYDGEFEVVVVDDGSCDETPAVLQEWTSRHPKRIRYLRQHNSGPAAARNRGAVEARGELLAFIDDDCLPERSWLRRLEEALRNSGTAAVAGAVINPEDNWIGRYINRESVIDHVVTPEGAVTALVTGNAAVRADLFRKLGGFDEAIRVAGGEDTEFGFRLRATGHRIAHVPEARVRHESRVDLAGYLRMIYRHGRGRRRLGERFPGYRLSAPHLRLLWLLWPVRVWPLRDYRRYRQAGISRGEALRYVVLRYLENIVRVAGYIRGN